MSQPLPPGTLTRFRRFLKDRMTYKPGWEFTLRPTVVGRPALTLEVRVMTPDASGRRPLVEAVANRPLPPHVTTEADLLREVESLIAELDAHERIEWLRVDGQCAWDPHPPNGYGGIKAVFGPAGEPRL